MFDHDPVTPDRQQERAQAQPAPETQPAGGPPGAHAPGAAGGLADPAPRLQYLPAGGDAPGEAVTPPTPAEIEALFAQASLSGGAPALLAPPSAGAPGGDAQRFVPNDEALQRLTARLVAVPLTDQQERAYAEQAIPLILQAAQARGVTDPDQLAYVLATAHHESRYGTPKYSRSESLVEDHNPLKRDAKGEYRTSHVTGHRIDGASLDTYYDDAYGGRLGNRRGTADAANFRGRGFVQLTGRTNYQDWTDRLRAERYSYTVDGVKYGGEDGQALDLTQHPEHVNKVPALAARILVEGMQRGSFTGERLGDDINEHKTDFVKARGIVNGDGRTNGRRIAGYAEGYARVLKEGGAWQAIAVPNAAVAAPTQAGSPPADSTARTPQGG